MSPRPTIPNDDMGKSFDALCFVFDNPALSPAQAEQAWRWVEDQARGRREALESERRRKKERRDYLAAVKAGRPLASDDTAFRPGGNDE